MTHPALATVARNGDEPRGLHALQPAHPTTVGKRATLLCRPRPTRDIDYRVVAPASGVKGTTGTQRLPSSCSMATMRASPPGRRVVAAMGSERELPVTGQTIHTKMSTDSRVCGIAAGAPVRFRVRVLQSSGNGGAFEASSGSSAMAYKESHASERISA